MAVIQTNKGAENFRLITIDLNNSGEENWKDLVPEHEVDVLEWATGVAGTG